MSAADYVAASTPALKFAGETPSFAGVTSTRGYAFNVTDPAGVMVTELAFYDFGADGLGEAHAVGLWNSAGNLLASATVAPGALAPLDANALFRLVDIPDFLLPQGNNYAVGAVFLQNSPDFQAFAWSSASTAPGIAYVQNRFNLNGLPVLSFPATSNDNTGLPGGSFQVAAVPEPGTWLVGAALLGISAFRRCAGKARIA